MKYQRKIISACVMITAIMLSGCGKKADDRSNINFKNIVESEVDGGQEEAQDVYGGEEDIQSEKGGVKQDDRPYSEEIDKDQTDDTEKVQEMFTEMENTDNAAMNQDETFTAPDSTDIQQISFRWEIGENEDAKGAELLLWVDEANNRVGIEGSSWAGINTGEFSGEAVAVYGDETLEFADENGNTLLVSPLEDGGIHVEESGITGGMGTSFAGTYQPIP